MKNMFSMIAAEKRIDFQVEVDKDFPKQVVTDRMRLEQVIKNLLSNAIKFTPKEGRVRLRLETSEPGSLSDSSIRPGEGEKMLAISVVDTGIGIPEDKQKLVFEAFKQVDGSNSRKYGGTGLGLTISRELCVLLGGDLTLHSVEGSGSNFTIHLPYNSKTGSTGDAPKQAPETETPAAGPAPAPVVIGKGPSEPHPELEGRTILIADDDMRNVYSLSVMLENEGMHVIVAHNGREAVDKLRSETNIDIVLMDIMMPEMDGYDAIRAARKIDRVRNLPIIAITAKAMKEDRQKCLDAGASDYLSKPLKAEALFAMVSTWLDARKPTTP
jgi:two-component system chemotaxis sensor kinase CheA